MQASEQALVGRLLDVIGAARMRSEVRGASIDSRSIDSRSLPDSPAEVYEQDTQTAYLAPADVLFDFDRSDLRADAFPPLRTIARDITTRSPQASLTIEGHADGTDDPDGRAINRRVVMTARP